MQVARFTKESGKQISIMDRATFVMKVDHFTEASS